MKKNIMTDEYFKCICHPEQKKKYPYPKFLHRVPIDCETRSLKEVKRDKKILKEQTKKELSLRKNRKYKNPLEEFDDKVNCFEDVGGWRTWNNADGQPDIDLIRHFIEIEFAKKDKKIKEQEEEIMYYIETIDKFNNK